MATKQPQSLAKATSLVALGTAFSRITGLIREQVIAYYFGAGMASDAFFAAFRLPNLLRDLFAEGALSSSFVPVFKEQLVTKGKERAFETANVALAALCVVVGLITIIGIIASPALVYLSAYGFADTPAKFDLTVDLTRIMFPFLLLVSLASLVMGVLNSFGRFGVAAASSAMFNLGSIVCILLFHDSFAEPVFALAIGVLIGGIGQLAVQLPQLFQLGFRIRLRIDLLHEDLKRIWKLFSPIVIGLSAGRINILVSTLLASLMVEGAMSYLNYAFRLMHFPLGVIAVSVGTVALPRATELVATGRRDELAQATADSLSVTLALIIPAAAVLALLGGQLVSLIYQWGAFSAAATEGTTRSLLHYSYGLLGFAAVRVVAPVYYALGDARRPMHASLISVGANLALYYPCIAMFNYAGLAAATSLAALVNLLLLLWWLPGQGVAISYRQLLLTTTKLTVAAVLAVTCALLIPYGLLDLLPELLARIGKLLAPLMVTGSLYILLAMLLGDSTVRLILKRVPVVRRLF